MDPLIRDHACIPAESICGLLLLYVCVFICVCVCVLVHLGGYMFLYN